ncbi:hypothetical protein [Altererythrobacter aquiaggeris]|uniref:hypothetical protein n=1 Tax=Aestuarierythrobacter aquiaggeris TaxID=1898396 RepID=UPI003017B400
MKAGLGMAALALSLLNGGCVAALLPIAAAGAMSTVQKPAAPNLAPNLAPNRAGTAGAPAFEIADAGDVVSPDPVMRQLPGKNIAAPPAEPAYEVLEITELPAPMAGNTAGPAGETGSYTAFTDFAVKRAQEDAGLARRPSAILQNPSRLDGKTQLCGRQPPAVLIDFDPDDDVFDPSAPGTISRDLQNALGTLADNSIEVLWISDLPENFAGEVVNAMRKSGISRVDGSALLLGAGEAGRKQLLRERAANRYCIVAIAGDEKGDFDEMYYYLRDPDSAIRLEPLFGNGWFLAPAPFLQSGS